MLPLLWHLLVRELALRALAGQSGHAAAAAAGLLLILRQRLRVAFKATGAVILDHRLPWML